MSPEVWDAWECHYALRPWGGAADDERLAYALMIHAQLQTGGKLRIPEPPDLSREPWQLKDFLLHQYQLPAQQPKLKWEFQPEDPEAYLRRLDATWAARGWARR